MKRRRIPGMTYDQAALARKKVPVRHVIIGPSAQVLRMTRLKRMTDEASR